MRKNYWSFIVVFLVIIALTLLPIASVYADADYDVQVSIDFLPQLIGNKQTSRHNIELKNPNAFAISGLAFTDSLPTGLTVASTPNMASSCGGVVSVSSDKTQISIVRGFVAANESCSVAVDVIVSGAGNYGNTIDAGSITGTGNNGTVSNLLAGTATLTASSYEYPATLLISLNPDYITQGSTSQLFIDIYNPNSFALTNASLAAMALPSGVSFAATPSAASTCGGTVNADTNLNQLSYSGGTVPAMSGGVQGTCRISVYVTSSTKGDAQFTVASGGFTADGNSHTGNVANLESTSSPLHVATISIPVQINKKFSPTSIYPNEESTLSITIYNPNEFELTNASWTDNLIGVQPGLRIADVPGVVNDISNGGCGGTVIADPGGSSISLSGGMLPAKISGLVGQCTISVKVTSTTQGNLTNTIQTGTFSANPVEEQNVSNTDPASHTLNVKTILAPTISKTFTPNTVWVEGSSQLAINIANPDTHSISNVSLTDVLPANVVVATPINLNIGSGCVGASVDATSGSGVIYLHDATIAGGATCTVKVDVKSAVPGVYYNRIEAGAVNSYENVTNAFFAQAQLNVQATEISKQFSPASFEAGEETTLTITLSNRDKTKAYTNVGLVDVLPSPLYYKSATTSCREDTVVDLTSTGSPARVSTLTLSGGTLPQASVGTPIQTCTITAVVSAAAGSVKTNTSKTNTLAAGALTTDEGVTNLTQAQASVTINPITVAVSKAFSVTPIQAGGDSVLTVTISNQTTKDLHNISLLDSMPVGLLLNGAYSPTTTCTLGTPTVAIVEANPPTTTTRGLQLSGVTLLSKSSCSFSAHVTTDTSLTARTLTNTIPAEVLQSDEEVTNLVAASKGITIYTTGLGLTGDKSFSPSVVMVGATTRMTINITAPQDRAISNLTVIDVLPTGLVFTDTPNPSVSCGGGATLGTSGTTFTLSGGSIAATGTCTFSVNVKGTEAKTFTNTITAANVTSGTTPEDSQTLSQSFSGQVRVTSLQISKAFYPDTIAPEGLSKLTITLTNTNPSKLVSVNLTDTFPAVDDTNGYFVVAPTPNVTTTCGVAANIITATPGLRVLTMTGGEIPAQVGGVPGVCTITVDVQGKRTGTVPTVGKATNTISISDVSATIYNSSPTATLQPVASVSKDLNITGLTLGVIKSFDPLTVFGGTSSVLSITMVNENNVTLTGINFTDVMPDGMYIANPPNLSTGTCGGTLSGTAGSKTITFSGGVLTGLKRCTVTLNVTMNKNGNLTNTISARGINSFNGAYNTQSASATLTNLPGVSITKYFTPSTIVLGEQSTLTIEITNTGNVPLDGLSFTDTLPGTLPNGLYIAAGTTSNTCNGDLTVEEDSNSIELINGSILAGPGTTCSITVPVTSTVPGTYVNTISGRSLTTNQKATNSDAATDTLKITAAPDLQLIKTGELDVTGGTDHTKADAGDVINYTMVATNLGDVTLNHVTITDPKITTLTCIPDAAGLPDHSVVLAKGQTLSCTGSYTLTTNDLSLVDNPTQIITNTATVLSKLPDTVTNGPTDTDTISLPLNKDYAVGLKKEVTSTGPYKLGTVVHYLITATNPGLKPITAVTISDPGVTLGSCTPDQGSALAPGETLTCTATYTIQVADVDLGSYSNTATVTANDEGGTAITPATDTAVVPIKQSASIDLFKEIVTDGPYVLNTVVHYEISAKNTGEQTLNNVTIIDPTVTFSPACSAVTLLPEETVTCYATHTVNASDMSNGGYRNTASVTSKLSTGSDGPEASATKTIVTNQPKIALTKVGTLNDANHNGMADAGEAIDYAFTINNNGPVTLTNVVLADIIGGVTISGDAIDTLAVGATDNTTFTGTYTLKQSDINAGTFTNTAIVTGTPPVGSPVSASAIDLQNTLSEPSISIDKLGVLDMTTVAPNTRVDAGDKIDYTFTVTNTGNVALTGVVLSDSKFTVTGSSIGSLAIGATKVLTSSYTLTQADVNEGLYSNTASVTGTPPTGSDATDSSTVDQTLTAVPLISLDKVGTFNDVNSNSRADAGDTITYAFTVTNLGNVTLTNVAVTDPKVTVSGASVTLQPGDPSSGHFTGTYTLKQSDIDTGSLDNTATVTGTNPAAGTVTDTDDDHQNFVQVPSILLVKTGVQNMSSNSRIDAGETITYSFKVTNTGNVTLTNVGIADSMFTVTGSPIDSLAPGASNAVTLTMNHTVLQSEINSETGLLHNTATVTGTPPQGGDPVTSTDDDTETLVPVGSMTLTKTATLHQGIAGSATVTDPGDTITYTFTVTNTGNVTLSNITLADLKVVLTGGPITSLDPGASDTDTFSAYHTLTQADIDAGTYNNTATATGKTPKDATITADGSASKSGLATPSITLDKAAALHDTNGNDRVDAGETISYTFTVVNTGNVDLTNVTVSDANVTTVLTGGPIATLAIGATDSTTYTAVHTITQAEINSGSYSNSATVTGKPPTGSNVTDPASVTTTLTEDPKISIIKTGTYSDFNSSGRMDAGDKITYTFSVSNPGNITLTNVTVTDPKVTVSGSSVTLQPGDTSSGHFTGTYTLKQSDIDAGSFDNTATATGTKPTTGTVTSTDGDHQDFVQVPSITLVKTGVQNKGGNSRIDKNETITYSFLLTNTGNVTLTNVTVADSRVSVTGSPWASLAPGATKTLTGTYTVSQADIDSGSLYNSATVTATPPIGLNVTATDDDTQTLAPVGTMTLTKTGTLHQNIAGSATVTDPGDTITYTFTVANTGNVTLSTISLSDSLAVLSGSPIASLAPAASDSSTYTATHVLTQADIDATHYDNSADASGTTPKNVTINATGNATTTALSTPSITLSKNGILNDQNSNGRVDAGETISYTFTVTNTGNVALNPITLTDLDANTVISGGPISLAIGASDTTSFTGVHTISQVEINAGTFMNTATVSGKPPTGSNVTANATYTQPLDASAGLSLVKTGTLHDGGNGAADVGDTITYTFTITNIGNVTLTNVSVADKVGGVTVTGSAIPSLAPGASNNSTYTGSYTIKQADIDAAKFDNTATVTGTKPLGGTTSADGSTSVTLDAHPAITIVKTGTLNKTVVAPAGVVNAGDVINYTLKVTNTGNVSLHEVVVSDSKIATITGSAIGNLAPGTSAAVTLNASYTLTQADIDAGTYTNTASVTGKSPSEFVVNSSEGDTQTLEAASSILMTKTGTLDKGADGLATPGDLINYVFVITNTGNTTLSTITLADPKATIIGGPSIASLAPGASSSIFTGTYALKQSDIDSGTFTNTATATGNPPIGSAVTSIDGDTQSGLSTPAITLVKTGTVNIGDNSRADAGETITYHFTVANTGNVALTNVRVTDPLITINGGPISLSIGASDSSTFSGTYTLSQTDINNGSLANTATVTGTPPTGSNVSAQSSVTKTLTADKQITLLKEGTADWTVVAPADKVNVGDKISYKFTITNPGNVTLTNIMVTDPKITVSGTAITLAPGASNSSQFSGTYTITQADLDAGVFSNTASVSGTPPVGLPITATSTDTKSGIASPTLTVEKTGVIDLGLDGVLGAGDVVNYTFKIKNTGNVALTNVTINEDTTDVTLTGSAIASLAIGATDQTAYTAQYTLKQEDLNAGSFTNHVTVTGTPPTGADVTSTGTDTRELAQAKTLTLLKVGTLDKTKVPLDSEVNAGDIITYKFTVTNTGNVTLTNVVVTDPLMTVVGDAIASLAPGATDDTTFSGSYTINQDDIDLGTFYNIATVTGNPPSGDPVTSTGESSVFLVDQPIIGVAKKMVGQTTVSAGTHDVTMDILIKNYGNVTLHNVQVTDDLTDTFPQPTTFTVQSITSSDTSLVLNNNSDNTPIYNGDSDINLLKTGTTLEVGQSKTLRLVVRVVPTSYGPFLNTAWASGIGPEPNPDPNADLDDGKLVNDESVSDVDLNPDPNKDHNPNNDQGGTPIEFGDHIFDPPSGIKTLDANLRPVLKWTMVWINDTNIVGVHAVVHDPISQYTEFAPDLLDSGFGVPGTAPDGSTSLGVSCVPTEGSTQTTTDLCYYEGPTDEYPRGQIIWEGTLGPDLGVKEAMDAKNAISITFGVRVKDSTVVTNTAFIDSDLNGDGDVEDEGERKDAQAVSIWDVTPDNLPKTGFAPNQVSLLPHQTTTYTDMGDFWLEIPRLDVNMPIVGVPMVDNNWDVSWLGTQAGWLDNTAYPTTAGNAVITGHVYLPNGKPGPFVDLKKLGWNDKIIIHIGEKQYIYRVQQLKQVKPEDLTPLKNEASSWLTLITCQGYDESKDTYLYRQVIKAVLVETK